MGKKFEAAKRKIGCLLASERAIERQLEGLRQERIILEREWYGVAGGDIMQVSMFEVVFKAAKRWAM